MDYRIEGAKDINNRRNFFTAYRLLDQSFFKVKQMVHFYWPVFPRGWIAIHMEHALETFDNVVP